MKVSFQVLSVLTGGLGMVLSPLASADFLSDSKANLNLRNFYFNNDNRDGTAAPSKTEEWGQGFMLNYQSGFTEGTVGFGVDAIGLLGITLDSGEGRHVGSSMIPNDGDKAADEWSRFGATGKVRFSKTELRYGTLQPKLPILVANDGRVLPQTFEGGLLTSKEINERLAPTLERLGIRADVLGDIAGIHARRLWDDEVQASDAATMAGRKALEDAGIEVGKLGLLGFDVDHDANLKARFGKGGEITKAGSTKALVIPTNEEWVIAHDALELVGA